MENIWFMIQNLGSIVHSLNLKTQILEARIEAEEVYIIDSRPQMELALAAVKLMPFDNDSNYKNIKKK
jgi:hypothetical protein